MSAIGTAQFGKSPSKLKCSTRRTSKVAAPSLFVPPLVLKPAIREPPPELLKTARPTVHDGFEETKSGQASKKAKTPAKVDDTLEIIPEPAQTVQAVYSHSDVASKIMASAASGKPAEDSGKPPTAPALGRKSSFIGSLLGT